MLGESNYVPRQAEIVRTARATSREKFFELRLLDGSPLGHRPGQFAMVDLPAYARLKKRAFILMETLMDAASDLVITDARATYDDARRRGLVPAAKLRCIPTGIGPGQYAVSGFDRRHYLSQLGVPAEAPVIGCVARLSVQKGLTYLLAAMPAIG